MCTVILFRCNELLITKLIFQNPVVLQRVPSPQELAVHTQSILQNALIKRKLEEQKENFRKRQEAQRSVSFKKMFLLKIKPEENCSNWGMEIIFKPFLNVN